MRLVLLTTLFLLFAVMGEAAVIWPDSVENRDQSLYYVKKTDTVKVDIKTVGDVTTTSIRLDSIMARKIPTCIHVDSLLLTMPEIEMLSGFLWQKLRPDTALYRKTFYEFIPAATKKKGGK